MRRGRCISIAHDRWNNDSSQFRSRHRHWLDMVRWERGKKKKIDVEIEEGSSIDWRKWRVLVLLPWQSYIVIDKRLFLVSFISVLSLSFLFFFSFFFLFFLLVTVLSMDGTNFIDSRMSHVVAFIVEVERCVDSCNKKQNECNETLSRKLLM